MGQVSGNPSPIKSVQRGTISLSGVSTATATISAVNIAKSTVHFLGYVTAATAVSDGPCRLVLTNSTTVTADRNSSTSASYVAYEVIEWA